MPTPEEIAKNCRYRIMMICGCDCTYGIYCTGGPDGVMAKQMQVGPWHDIDDCIAWGLSEGLWVSREVALCTIIYAYTAEHYDPKLCRGVHPDPIDLDGPEGSQA